MKNANRIFSAFMILVLVFLLTGGIFKDDKENYKFNPEKNKVYECVTIDVFYGDKGKNKKNHGIINNVSDDEKSAYNGKYVLVYANYYGAKNKECFEIYSKQKPNIIIECKKDSKTNLSLNFDDHSPIGVYGKCEISHNTVMQKTTVTIKEVRKVITPEVHSDSEKWYYVLDEYGKEKSYKMTENDSRILGVGTGGKDQRVKYYIPDGWNNSIESKINASAKNTYLAGNKYALNFIYGLKNPDTEYLFILYYDKEGLVNRSDINKSSKLDISNPDPVMKAIVDNIEGSETKLKACTGFKTNDNKESYICYHSKYKGYSVEYIFMKDKGRGVVGLVYFYMTPNHLSDVMYVANSMKLL